MRRWGRITSWQRIWWNFASADWRELHFIPRLVAQDIEQNTAVDRTTFSKRSPARSGLHWDLRQIGWGVRPSTFADRASQVIFGMDTSQYYLFAVLGPHVLPWQHIDYIWTIYHRPHLSYSLSSATSQGPQWHHLARFGLFLRPHFHHIYRSHC
jgi:hypothetical protein